MGVNTAIVSTTGSFSGIGFAVPSDAVGPVVRRMIQNDKVSNPRTRVQVASGETVAKPAVKVPWLGVQIVSATSSPPPSSSSATRKVVADADSKVFDYVNTNRLAQGDKNWILNVAAGSPADQVGMKGITIKKETASVSYGDAIVAVGGNTVSDFADLQNELGQRKVGEQVAVTLEDGETGERRVVYLFLTEQPESSPSD